MDELTQEQINTAKARGEARQRLGPLAERVHYDAQRDRIIVRLNTGIEIGFAPADAQGLENATAADLSTIEIFESGLAINFPALDEQFGVPELVEGRLGSDAWMAHRRGTRAAE